MIIECENAKNAAVSSIFYVFIYVVIINNILAYSEYALKSSECFG